MTKTDQDFQPATYLNLHKDIRFDRDLSFGERLFLAEICSISQTSKCDYSSRHLGKIFGVSHQTILNWIEKLVEKDYIELCPNKDNIYKPCIKPKVVCIK